MVLLFETTEALADYTGMEPWVGAGDELGFHESSWSGSVTWSREPDTLWAVTFATANDDDPLGHLVAWQQPQRGQTRPGRWLVLRSPWSTTDNDDAESRLRARGTWPPSTYDIPGVHELSVQLRGHEPG